MIKKKKSKKMTLDKLAIMIGKGFNETTKNFVAVNAKFEAMDKKVETLRGDMNKKFEQVDENFKQITQKINNISLNIVDVVRKEEFEKLESRVVNLEKVGE